jgi:hypothetical protein
MATTAAIEMMATRIFDEREPPPRAPPRCCFTTSTATPNSPKVREISDYAQPSQTTLEKTSETVHFPQMSLDEFFIGIRLVSPITVGRQRPRRGPAAGVSPGSGLCFVQCTIFIAKTIRFKLQSIRALQSPWIFGSEDHRWKVEADGPRGWRRR